MPSKNSLDAPVRQAIEVAVYLLLIFAILSWCLQILMPFVSFLAWGSIIAVAMHQPFLKLRAAVGERNKLAVLIFVILGLATILVPAWMFTGSIIDGAQQFKGNLQSGEFTISPANESVRSWPVVGEPLYNAWDEASSNLEEFLESHHDQVKQITSGLLGKLASVGLSVLQFIAATLIAAVLLANESTTRVMTERLCRRLVGAEARDMMTLASATIRSISVGVLGIAFIQAVLLGGGMLVVGVPGAGFISLAVLVIVIAQVPALLIMAPVMAYVFSTEPATTAIIFAVYSVLASASDMFLKPIMLGRGVEAPMLVILLGAIGGMVMSGIIGLFLGAVILALGYKLFQAWMGEDVDPAATDDAPAQVSAE
jgi:predicted PurR-regulated permease PerM